MHVSYADENVQGTEEIGIPLRSLDRDLETATCSRHNLDESRCTFKRIIFFFVCLNMEFSDFGGNIKITDNSVINKISLSISVLFSTMLYGKVPQEILK